MKRRLLFALMLAAFAPAFTPAIASAAAPVTATGAAPAANRFAATIVPAETFEVGAMLVERHGAKGRPLILIPGLASGAWAWQETLRQFATEHVIYVVTLPGFDGRAAPATDSRAMEAAQQALVQLIDSRKLAHPVLVGHSLGGTLSYALAAQLGARIGGVLAIDGLPVFPGTEDLPLEQRAAMAQQIAARNKAPTAAIFAAQQQQYMRGIGVSDMARADELAKLSGKSDPGAVMQYMSETLALDLRPLLPKISAPVLVLTPYFGDDDQQNQTSQADKVAYYKALLDGVPKLEVAPVAPARHFAMFDQPQQVNDALRRFLKSL